MTKKKTNKKTLQGPVKSIRLPIDVHRKLIAKSNKLCRPYSHIVSDIVTQSVRGHLE